MFRFFLPASKVQKDRKIMRETDSRMAKYSRRGVIFNFFAFLVCMVYGRFIDEHPTLTIVLTLGLLFVTVIRGIYLFRFDHLYPRAPAKWRNRYFIATLIGAMWWGLILASVTIALGMENQAALLWLYTVIFFSSTAHAFAPYQKFLSYYQFFGQIPAAGAAFYLGTLDGYLYGTMMLVFYLVLTHQCRLISENYWERLEATYALARKTQSIEEEKRDTRADVELNREFLGHLNQDVSRVIEEIESPEQMRAELEALHLNVQDFSGVLSKSLVLEDKIFNIRHEIQHLVAEFVDTAEERYIQVETSLSPTLPMRLKGDASRLAQVIRSLLDIMTQNVERCVVLIEVEFIREYESAGELYVSVTRSFDKAKRLFFNDSVPDIPKGSLSLVVAKGLADLMDGSIEYNEALRDENQFRFNAKIDIAERAGQLDFHKDSFAGRNVLLVHNHPRIVDIKRQELDALGFNVFTETQYNRAISTLENSYKFQNPIESLLFYLEPDNQAVVGFCEELCEIAELKYTKKIGATTRQQQKILRDTGFDESRGFYYVDKPTGLFEIESMFHRLYKLHDEASVDSKDKIRQDVALLSSNKNIQLQLKQYEEDLDERLVFIDEKKTLIEQVESGVFSIVLLDFETVADVAGLAADIRSLEMSLERENLMPILGFSTTGGEYESNAYELGIDDYVDLEQNPSKNLRSTIAYWRSLTA